MKFILFASVFFLINQSVIGQVLYGKFLDHRQGLLSKECYDINYSKEGYLIVSTQYGPMKYDGERFISICLNLPIEKRIMYDFEKDSKGRIYLLNSRNELFILQGDKAVSLNPKVLKKIPEDIRFKKIHAFSKGLILFSNATYYFYSFTSGELKMYNDFEKKENCLINYNSQKEFPFDKYRSREILNRNHTVHFKNHQQSFTFKDQMSSEAREDFIQVGKNRFVLINSRLYLVSPKQIKIFPYSQILFMEFFHDRLWVSTNNGLIELDKKGNLIQVHFPGMVIGGVVPISKEGIGVSLNQQGVFICSNIHERIYPQIKPTEIAYSKKLIIIGNKRGEIFEFKNNRCTQIQNWLPLPQVETSSSLKHIRRIEFIDGRWYVSTIKGIYFLSPDLKSKQKFMLSNYYSFNDFFFAKGKIYAISWSDISSSRLERQAEIPLIRCKYQVNDSVVLLGSEKGLFEYRADQNKLTRSKFFRKPYFISFIQKLAPNEYLISSRYKGIFHFRDGHLVKFYSSPCISLKKAFISKGKLIAAGNEGIFVKHLNSNRKISWTKIFDKEIQNLFLIENKLFICSDDDLITKNFNSQNSTKKSPILLNGIILGDQKTTKLPHSIPYNVPITFDFDILHFDANKLGLYYRLKGEVTHIQYAPGTKINFDALPSGEYQLELFPVIDGKIQFSNSKQYSFTINEPFWESTLFYLLISIVIFLALVSIRLIRNLKRKKRMAERAELESKLNEYKLLAVKAQVNPHFLSNGLSAIQALILKEDNDLAAQYLAKFSFLMRKTLYYSEQQFISVSDELQLVDAYLELEQLRFQNKFEIRRSIRLSEYELKNTLIPSLLLQPIMENAIWHGLKFQENNPVLSVIFEKDTYGKLRIVIQDNGPGFQNHNKNEKHLSKGNQLITERIDTLNKQFGTLVASIRIQSLENGTSVTFVFDQKLTNP